MKKDRKYWIVEAAHAYSAMGALGAAMDAIERVDIEGKVGEAAQARLWALTEKLNAEIGRQLKRYDAATEKALA